VPDDGHLGRRGVLRGERPALRARLGIGACLVIRDRRGGYAVDADHDPRLVHHLEHVVDPAVRLPDQPPVTVAALAEREREAGQASPADLVDHACDAHVVVDEATIDDPPFGYTEERDALDACRRTVDAREGHVDDVVGDVVISS
jgi:hypothetical protein